VRQGSGEPVVDLGRGEVGGAVVGVGGGEHEFLGAEALIAIDGLDHLGMQAGGDGEQLRGDERQTMAAAVVEVEGARVEAGPVTAGDPSGGAVAAHRDARRRSDFGLAGAGGKAVGRGRRRCSGYAGMAIRYVAQPASNIAARHSGNLDRASLDILNKAGKQRPAPRKRWIDNKSLVEVLRAKTGQA